MKPEDVAAELVGIACKAAYGGVWAFSDERYVMTRALAAVLPAYRTQLVRQLANQAAGLVVAGPEGFGVNCRSCDRTVLAASDGDVDALTVLGAVFGHLIGETHAAHTTGSAL